MPDTLARVAEPQQSPAMGDGSGRLFLHGFNELIGFSNGAVHVSDQSVHLGIDLEQLSLHSCQGTCIEVVLQVEHLVSERS
jgi:Response regulator receiver domain